MKAVVDTFAFFVKNPHIVGKTNAKNDVVYFNAPMVRRHSGHRFLRSGIVLTQMLGKFTFCHMNNLPRYKGMHAYFENPAIPVVRWVNRGEQSYDKNENVREYTFLLYQKFK